MDKRLEGWEGCLLLTLTYRIKEVTAEFCLRIDEEENRGSDQ